MGTSCLQIRNAIAKQRQATQQVFYSDVVSVHTRFKVRKVKRLIDKGTSILLVQGESCFGDQKMSRSKSRFVASSLASIEWLPGRTLAAGRAQASQLRDGG